MPKALSCIPSGMDLLLQSTMSPSKSSQPGLIGQTDDPAPVPPIEPELEDCCGSGCNPCIFDIYEQARERYQRELEAWNRRQAERAATAGKSRRKGAK